MRTFFACLAIAAAFPIAQAAEPAPAADDVGVFADYHVPAGPFLFATPQQIAAARKKGETLPWARGLKAEILRAASRWASLSREDLIRFVPPKGAYYVYGLSIPTDPQSGRPLVWSGWDAPFLLHNDGGQSYPNPDFPDSGKGWKDAQGDVHYFAAYANARRVMEFEQQLLPALTDAWILTGDENYSRHALWLLDAIASIYPAANSGPLDYPGDLPDKPGGGRLQRPGYQSARALLRYGYFYDILSACPDIDGPSPSEKGLTIRQNVLENLIGNGGTYCYEQAVHDPRANNGATDYNRGALVAGALLGWPRYLAHAVYGGNGFEAALFNAVDSQGRYFESSSGYDKWMMGLMHTTALMIEGVNRGLPHPLPSYFDNQRFVQFCVGNFSRIEVAGRTPLYGDSGPDHEIVGEDRWFDAGTYMTSLSFLTYAHDPGIRRMAARQLAYMLNGDPALELTPEYRAKLHNYLMGGMGADYQSEASEARLLLEGDLGETFRDFGFGPADWAIAPLPDTVLPAAGMAFLRHGAGAAHEAAAFLRFGPTFNHGHLDELTLQLYAFGREFTAGPGYYNTHYRFGFTQTTVAHNTLVVDRQNQLEKPSTGGHLLSWMPGPLFSSVEADDPGAYSAIGLAAYRRRVAAVDCDGVSYWIDTFRVRGGAEYDYSFHGVLNGRLSVDPSTAKAIRTSPGSVLSPDCNYSEDLTPAGRLKSFPDKSFYWEVPGEGYGFLGHPQTFQPGPVVRLEWSATDRTGHRLTWYHLPPAQAELIVAHVHSPPTLSGGDQFDYALSHVHAPRDATVRFQSVIRAQSGASTDAWSVRRLGLISGAPDLDAGGIEITGPEATGTGKFNHVYLSCAFDREPAAFPGGIVIKGTEGFASSGPDGRPRVLALTGAGYLRAGGVELRTHSPLADGATVLALSENPLRIRVAADAGILRAAGSVLLVGSSSYVKPMPFQVLAVEAAASGEYWITLDADNACQSIFAVSAVGAGGKTLSTLSEFPRLEPFVDGYDRQTGESVPAKRRTAISELFDGFTVASPSGARAQLLNNSADRRTLYLQTALDGAQPGERLRIEAPNTGDRVQLLLWARAARRTDGWDVEGFGKIVDK